MLKEILGTRADDDGVAKKLDCGLTKKEIGDAVATGKSRSGDPPTKRPSLSSGFKSALAEGADTRFEETDGREKSTYLRSLAVVGLGIVSLVASACHPADTFGPNEEETGEAPFAQIGIGYLNWRHYSFRFANEERFADLLVIGDENVGEYYADTEYWFVETSNLQYLGEEDLEVDCTDGDATPPLFRGDQEFTQPVYLTWHGFITTDPQASEGELYSHGNHHLRIKVDRGEISKVTWYQTITNQSPQNVAPDGVFVPAGGSVSVPTGQYGYYIHATID